MVGSWLSSRYVCICIMCRKNSEMARLFFFFGNCLGKSEGARGAQLVCDKIVIDDFGELIL